MSEVNNKVLDIDKAELEIGCRVAFAINNREMRIGHIINIEPSTSTFRPNDGRVTIRIEGTNRTVRQWSSSCCRIRNKREE